MSVLVVETRGGCETASTACESLAGRVGVVRCTEADLEAFLGATPAPDLDLFVVACGGDADAGHRVCRSVRSTTSTPLAMVTSSRREADELLAFARGCDDYITTMSSPEVLRARLESLASRRGRRRFERVTVFGTLVVDPLLREATVHGDPVALTRIEFDLLHTMVTQQRRVVPRRELLEVGWGECPPCDHALDVHLSRLRRKVLQAGGPRIGVPVPGVGYRVGSPDTSRQEEGPESDAPRDTGAPPCHHRTELGGTSAQGQPAWV